MLRLGSLLTGTIGVCWSGLFAMTGDWSIVGPDLAALALSLASLTLLHCGRLRQASFLYVFAVFGLTVFAAVRIDVPSANAPRSVHLFLPSLAVCACLLFRTERGWARHGIPAVCLLAFAFFCTTNSSFGSVQKLSDDVRVIGVWVDAALSIVCLFVSVLVIQSDAADRNGIDQQLKSALIQGQFLLHYQPQMGNCDELIGAEALLRWNHPTRGFIPPNDFIPAAESANLMTPIGDWVLRAACLQLVRWQTRPETRDRPLAINVSASQFAEADFVERVLGVIAETRAPATLLKIELTENVLADDIDDVIAKMLRLKEQGVQFSLDDFGTGFSSLSYLQRLPLNQLKIDQSFVRNLLRSPQDQSIAKAIIALADSLGLDVIAEGVETAAHRDFLVGLGCNFFQGYLFSKPLPVAAFEAFAHASYAVPRVAETASA